LKIIYLIQYNYIKASYEHEVRYGFDEPHGVLEVHYLMKTIHLSDETSCIVSCTVKKYKKNMQ